MLEKLGLVKLVEECGELTQIAAKKMTRMDTDEHWDGNGTISERLENEIADVLAAAHIVTENFQLNEARINERSLTKVKLFRQWMNEKEEKNSMSQSSIRWDILRLIPNFPASCREVKQIKGEIKSFYFDLAYGVTPALFITAERSGETYLERVRLERSGSER